MSNLVKAMQWNSNYSERAVWLKNSAIRDLFKYLGDPNIISFAGGLPAPETFPVRAFKEACYHVLNTDFAAALQYGATEGDKNLRGFLVEKMQRYGVPAEMKNILITSGSQQALDLIGKVFVDERTMILTERPSYLGALQAWDSYGANYCTVPLDANGMMVDELPAIIKKYRPKFLYVLPNFHNPGGVTLSEERRHKLVEIAEKYDLFIVEDDPYGELRFEGDDLTPIVALAKERVFYLCTFSKTLAPGPRIGWVTAPEEVIKKLVQAKQGADLHTSTFAQAIVNDICQRGILKAHVKKTRAVYKERRDTMIAAMEKYFPPEVTWTHPQGGLFLWVTVPEKINTAELFHEAILQKVAFVIGSAFYPFEIPKDGETERKQHPDSLHTMRLNFSFSKPDVITEGIHRLGDTLKAALAK